ncbi:hypothetical protein ACFLZC_01885 [Patescibacteria group bacterium]
MKIISTTLARKNFSEILNKIKYNDQVFGVGRHEKIEAVIIKYPENINNNLNEITNINMSSSSFKFLEKEPNLYSVKDLKKKYA